MNNIFFIGTLHCGFTENSELEDIIRSLNPSLLLLEMLDTDIINNTITWYPNEMIFGMKLAQSMKVDYLWFDSKLSVLKKWVTKRNEQEIIEKQELIIKKYSRKDFNKEELNKKLSHISDSIIDQEKWNQRENEMKTNIIDILLKQKNKKIMIITGVGHIPFFQKKFPKANFPLT